MKKGKEYRCPVCSTKHFQSSEDLILKPTYNEDTRFLEIKCRRCRNLIKYKIQDDTFKYKSSDDDSMNFILNDNKKK